MEEGGIVSDFISEMMEGFKYECALLEKTRHSDGLGGSRTVWTEGMSFVAWFQNDTTTEANIASQQGYDATYSLLIDKGMELDQDDVFVRKSDGMKFRVNRDTPEKKTPATSALNKRLILCKKWEYPTDVSNG